MDIGKDLAEPVAKADLKAEADASAESSEKEYRMVTASVSRFKAPPPGCYTKSLMARLIRKVKPEELRKIRADDLRKIRTSSAKPWREGVAVGKHMEAKYTLKGRSSGMWFPCKVAAKETGGWRVVWGDGDKHNTLKTTEELRDSV